MLRHPCPSGWESAGPEKKDAAVRTVEGLHRTSSIVSLHKQNAFKDKCSHYLPGGTVQVAGGVARHMATVAYYRRSPLFVHARHEIVLLGTLRAETAPRSCPIEITASQLVLGIYLQSWLGRLRRPRALKGCAPIRQPGRIFNPCRHRAQSSLCHCGGCGSVELRLLTHQVAPNSTVHVEGNHSRNLPSHDDKEASQPNGKLYIHKSYIPTPYTPNVRSGSRLTCPM